MEREILAPPVPAIYLWVHDFIALLGASPKYVGESLDNFQNQPGRQWPFSGDHFMQGKINAARPHLRPDRRERVIEEISNGSAIGRSIATLATFQQRPLYCGITVNFGQRISQHLKKKTDFAQILTSVEPSQCAVLWMQVADEEAEAANATNLRSEEAEDGGDPLETDDEHLAKQVPMLNTFESLMIRVAMPMINKVLDS